ncbi:hypothetical protein Agabi119p4_9881 [Agaricus bisporus var. burnettii]|uniref:Uncharacterized protein n=1 Tax=Agaricus bisporus var. burnettii TaxID=192524 RepID=A0A8H7EX82_AGABI|nr:hypothetical protein Agabi119p4_9881 [Agaricus bisporus var. burnettii]
MTRVQGFFIKNAGESSVTIIDPSSSSTVLDATMTSKQFTMRGTYKLRGEPVTGGSTLVNLATVRIDTAGTLSITPAPGNSAASELIIQTLLD